MLDCIVLDLLGNANIKHLHLDITYNFVAVYNQSRLLQVRMKFRLQTPGDNLGGLLVGAVQRPASKALACHGF